GQHGLDAHELEILDSLRLAVLENLEVFGLQPLDDAAVALGIRIDGDEHRFPAKHRRALLLGILLTSRNQPARDRQDHGQHSANSGIPRLASLPSSASYLEGH